MQFSGDREIFFPDNSLFNSALVEHQIQKIKKGERNMGTSPKALFSSFISTRRWSTTHKHFQALNLSNELCKAMYIDYRLVWVDTYKCRLPLFCKENNPSSIYLNTSVAEKCILAILCQEEPKSCGLLVLFSVHPTSWTCGPCDLCVSRLCPLPVCNTPPWKCCLWHKSAPNTLCR